MILRRLVRQWISRLSEARSEFGGLPACPFAIKASCVYFGCVTAMQVFKVLGCLEELDDKAVAIIATPRKLGMTRTTFLTECRRMLEGRDVAVMMSDPSKPIRIAGFQTTQEHRPLLLVQSASALKEASQSLESTRYYRNWTQEQREKVRQ